MFHYTDHIILYSKTNDSNANGMFTVANLNCFLSHKKILLIAKGLIVLGFTYTSTLVGHFVSSSREREKREDSRGDEREGQGRKRNRNESEEAEEIKTFPLHPYLL